jgi:hypothetical protein
VKTERALKPIGLSVLSILVSPLISSKNRNNLKTLRADEMLSLRL